MESDVLERAEAAWVAGNDEPMARSVPHGHDRGTRRRETVIRRVAAAMWGLFAVFMVVAAQLDGGRFVPPGAAVFAVPAIAGAVVIWGGGVWGRRVALLGMWWWTPLALVAWFAAGLGSSDGYGLAGLMWLALAYLTIGIVVNGLAAREIRKAASTAQ